MSPIATALAPRDVRQVYRTKTRSVEILVATDRSWVSRSAYNAADLIAGQRKAHVHVLSVVEPHPTIVPSPGSVGLPSRIDKYWEEDSGKSVISRLVSTGHSAEWTVETRVGSPPAVIAEVATERQADLTIIGASHHSRLDRFLGDETATHLARLVERPLLVASPKMARLPKRVIIAVGLDSSNRAMLVRCLEILGSPASISCVHVEARSEFLGVDWAEFDSEYRDEVEAEFDTVNAALAALPGTQTELVIMHGDPVREINEFAKSVKAELIVLGVKRRRPFSLAPAGGIAMRVMRAAGCSVLLVPNHT